MPKLDVLVVGSTGRQGGAVARALLQGGHHVRALTRNLANPNADVLRLRGARLAWADLEDEKRLEDVARGVDAIFLVTSSSGTPARETRHGLAVTELARRLGVGHLVFASLPGAVTLSGHAVLDAKHEVEQYIRASGVPHTIVCPSFLMENLTSSFGLERLRRGELVLPVSGTSKLQQLARKDIARFTRVVLERGAEFHGRRVTVASDELTPIEMAASLARIVGQRVQHVECPLAELAASDVDQAALFATQHAPAADVVALRSEYPEVNWHTLDGWARRQDWPALLRST